MNPRVLCFLPLFALATACAAPQADSTGAESAISASSDGTCAGGGTGVVAKAAHDKLDSRLRLELDEALDAALATRSDAIVAFTHPKTAEEIAALGIVPRSVASEIATVDLRWRDALRLTAHPDVVTIDAGGALSPHDEGAEADANEDLPATAQAEASPVDIILEAKLAKLDPPLLASIEGALCSALSLEMTGIILLDKEMGRDEIAAMGLEPRSIIGDIVTANFTLEGALRATVYPEVVKIESSGPLFEEPGTGDPGGTHRALTRWAALPRLFSFPVRYER
jgi:hypothetical protein